MPVIFKLALPVLVSVTVCAGLVVFTHWLANVAPVRPTAGDVPPPAPVPESIALNVPQVEFVATVSVALCGTAAVGVNVTMMARLAPAARLPAPPPLTMANGAPAVRLTLEIFSGALPEFVSVTVCGALVVFTAWLPKFTLAGLRPPPLPEPRPLTGKRYGEPGALLLMESAADGFLGKMTALVDPGTEPDDVHLAEIVGLGGTLDVADQQAD